MESTFNYGSCVGGDRMRDGPTSQLLWTTEHMQWLLPAEEMNREKLHRSGEGSFCMSVVIIV